MPLAHTYFLSALSFFKNSAHLRSVCFLRFAKAERCAWSEEQYLLLLGLVQPLKESYLYDCNVMSGPLKQKA